MFGLFKKNSKLSFSPRMMAAAEVRAALHVGAAVLSHVLDEIGIDGSQLADERAMPTVDLARMMFEATRYQKDGREMELQIGHTLDQDTYSLEPHYRYREICWLVDDLVTSRLIDRERYLHLAKNHAPHALVQTSMLRLFLLRVPVVEDLLDGGDMEEIQRELEFSAKGVAGLLPNLPNALTCDLDLKAIQEEWVGWPNVFGVAATA